MRKRIFEWRGLSVNFALMAMFITACTIVSAVDSVWAQETIPVTITWDSVLGDSAEWQVVGENDLTSAPSDTLDLAPGTYQVNYAPGTGNKFFFTVQQDLTISCDENFVWINGSVLTIYPQQYTITWTDQLGTPGVFAWYIAYTTAYGHTELSYDVSLLPGNYHISTGPGVDKIYFTVNSDWTMSSAHSFVQDLGHELQITPQPFQFNWAPEMTGWWYLSYFTTTNTESSQVFYLIPGSYKCKISSGSYFIFNIDTTFTPTPTENFVDNYTCSITAVEEQTTVPVTITWATALGDSAEWHILGVNDSTSESSITADLGPGTYQVNYATGTSNNFFFTVNEDLTVTSAHDFVQITGTNLLIQPQTYTFTWSGQIGDPGVFEWYIAYTTDYGNTALTYAVDMLPGNYHISLAPGAEKIYFTINPDWSISSAHSFVQDLGHELQITPQPFTLTWDPKIGSTDDYLSWQISYLTNSTTAVSHTTHLLPGTYKVTTGGGSFSFQFDITENFTISSTDDFTEVVGDTLLIRPKLYTITWNPKMGDEARWSWNIAYITNYGITASSLQTQLLPGTYAINYGDGNSFSFIVNPDWTLTSNDDFATPNGFELIIQPQPFQILWEPKIGGSWYGSWEVDLITNSHSESDYTTYLLPGDYAVKTSWESSASFTIGSDFTVSSQQPSVEYHTISILPADPSAQNSNVNFILETNYPNNIFPSDEEPCVRVTVENSGESPETATILYTFNDLRGNLISQGEYIISVPASSQSSDVICSSLTSSGFATGVFSVGNLEHTIQLGRYDAIPQAAPSFISLPQDDAYTIDVGDPKSSVETNNPFGILTHRELPDVETVRLIADAGFGTSCENQFKTDQITAIDMQLALGVDPVIDVPSLPEGIEIDLAQAFSGKGLFYRVEKGEANNHGIAPGDFALDVSLTADTINSTDPSAKIVFDELGDVHPIDYMADLYSAGIGDAIDAQAWGFHLNFGGGSGIASAYRMADLAAYWSPDKEIQSFIYPMLHVKGGEIYHAKRTLRYAIHYYMIGIDRQIWYKMTDHWDDYGFLYIDGSIAPTYMAFQNLCSLLSYSNTPKEFPFKIEASEKLPDLVTYTLENGTDEIDIILWNNIISWENDPYDTAFRGADWLLPPYALRDQNLPPTSSNVVIGNATYKYPIIIDLLTGAWETVEYEIIGSDLILKNVEITDYPKMIKLVSGGVRPSNENHTAWETYTAADGLASDWVSSVLPDGDTLWSGVVSYGGHDADILSALDKNSGNWSNLQTHDDKAGFNVRAMVSDSTNVYVALWGRGVGIYNKTTGDWSIETIADGLGSPNVRDIILDDGSLWVATWGGGLSRYTIASGSWVTYKHTNDNELLGEGLANPYSISNWITSVAASSRYIWVGSFKHGISRFDKSSETWSNYRGQFATDRIWSIAVDNDEVWFGVEQARGGAPIGLIRYNELDVTWQTYSVMNNLVDQKVPLIEVDGENIWFGTLYSGLTRYHKTTDTWTAFAPETTPGLVDARLTSLKSTDDYFWATSWGGGVSRYSKADNTWETFTKEKGITKKHCIIHIDSLKILLKIARKPLYYCQAQDRAFLHM